MNATSQQQPDGLRSEAPGPHCRGGAAFTAPDRSRVALRLLKVVVADSQRVAAL